MPNERQLSALIKQVGLLPGQAIFIPGEVPTSKNRKRIAYKITNNPQTRWRYIVHTEMKRVQPFIIDSEFAQAYRKAVGVFYRKEAFRFRNMVTSLPRPIHVEFCFVRRTNGIWDFNNLTEVVQDLMVEHGWIDEDNTRVLLPHPPVPPRPPFIVSKDTPGVFIRVLQQE